MISSNLSKKIFFLFFFIVCFSSSFHAKEKQRIDFIENIELFLDSTKSLNFSEIQREGKFLPVKNGYTSPNRAGNYWFKITLKKLKNIEQNYFLTLNAGLHFNLTSYFKNKNSWNIQHSGLEFKNKATHKFSNPYFEIDSKNISDNVIYVKGTSKGCTLNYYFEVMSQRKFNEDQQRRQFSFGFFYGILSLILIINIFYYFTVKQKAFLLYAIYIFQTIFFCSFFDGIPFLGIFHSLGNTSVAWSNVAILCYFGIMPLMSVYYMQLEKNIRIFRLAVVFLVYTILWAIPLFIITSDEFAEFHFTYHNSTVLLGCIFLVYIGIKGRKTNKTLSRSFFIANIILITSLLLTYLEDYGVTSMKIYFDLIKLGSLMEVIILSLALALYFRTIKQDLTVKSGELSNLSNEFLSLEDRFLSSQMNPHFTFNAMNSIHHYIVYNDMEMAEKYLVKYSRLIRKVLENNMEKLVSIEDETKMLSLYMDIESMRFKDGFEYEITSGLALKEARYMIPPMILQPYIENAIFHGIIHKKRGKGKIIVSFEIENDKVKICIEDNGIGRDHSALNKKKSTSHKSLGMLITHQRIKYANASEEIIPVVQDLKNQDNSTCGTKVILHLPIVID